MSEFRRRLMMAGKALPYDAEIEFLQSTGTQYIDTGIVPNNTTGIYIHAEHKNNNDTYLAGLRDTTGNTRWCIGSKEGFYGGFGSVLNDITNAQINAELQLNWLNDRKFRIGNIGTQNLPTLPFTPVNQVRLFGSSGIVASYSTWSGKIYGVKISQGSDIIMDLVPVRIGTVGYMYDRVSGNLFGNNGSGAFILGNDVNT